MEFNVQKHHDAIMFSIVVNDFTLLVIILINVIHNFKNTHTHIYTNLISLLAMRAGPRIDLGCLWHSQATQMKTSLALPTIL